MMTWRNTLLTVGLFVGLANTIGGQTTTTSNPICMHPADVIFALDSSGSVGAANFNKTLDLVKNVVQRIVHFGPNGINIGILTFASNSTVQFHLNAYTTRNEIMTAINNISYTRGNTNTPGAIAKMRQMFKQGRNDSTRYGVVITDGHSSSGDPSAEADLARQDNITMFAVGVGSNFDLKELAGIANTPSAGFVYNVTAYDHLLNLLDSIQDLVDCDGKTDGDIGEPCKPTKICIKNNTVCTVINKSHTICSCAPGYQVRIINGQKQCEKVDACTLGEICYNNTNCVTNSECIYDGSNSATTRCLCKYGYVHAVHNGICQCATVITTDVDPDCKDCESNGGICYDATGDQQKDGCVCPSFKSEPDCQKSHVAVMCDVTTFTMTVCYEEQAQYKAGGAVVLVEGHGSNVACTATKITSPGSVCPVGQHQLVLPLAETKRTTCSTQKFSSDITTTRYQNKILVQHHVIDTHQAVVGFMAYCSYDTHANVRFNPIGVAIATDERGEHPKPTLSLNVENNRGIPIGQGQTIRLGDWIRFRIHLLRDGAYAAIKVLQCLASSKATIPDSNAVTLPLVIHSCPNPGQNHITDKNNWKQVSGKPYELRTGRLHMFKLSAGHAVHIHCMVQLCLAGSEDDCAKVNCTHPAVHSSSGRSRRSTSTIFRLSKTLSWYDTKPESLTKDIEAAVPSSVFIGILSVVSISMIVFVVLVASLTRSRCRHQPNEQGCSSS